MTNPEGDKRKVLFVCAVGRLRSATAMHLMNRLYGYNTRCCGTDDGALIPLNSNLLYWADEIVAMEDDVAMDVLLALENHGINQKVKSLRIPDEYEYMDEELCSLIQRRYFS